jgi:hypothetical protein
MLSEVRRAKENAERSATDKSNFMAFLCHELRNKHAPCPIILLKGFMGYYGMVWCDGVVT